MGATREGRSVWYSDRRYEFLSIEQAMGFVRFLDQGKDLDHACRIWRPKRIYAGVGACGERPAADGQAA
ncbi:Uncharacterised protein [Bordetella pertussis]|uniref:Uncharacterized protein n=1 Tax=Bordetella pertussis TaxID=520 RepID=A0A0E8CAI7_BORPT|nr:hypothetical protein [Bordetella pertussis]KCV23859.1 hypothetical protein AZ28_3135 [Bordetella pertussis B200]ALX21027.1 hypothetical protein UN82_07080 [Bordetella pertussis]ALX25496.1 hypothetical protein RD18_12310 [Bordetella pertussis]AMG22081.1 hypothetical protein AL474_06465 [Bordetella pertussis]AMS51033.1 hypothetical protein RD08_07085 [Bordetella pertussis]